MCESTTASTEFEYSIALASVRSLNHSHDNPRILYSQTCLPQIQLFCKVQSVLIQYLFDLSYGNTEKRSLLDFLGIFKLARKRALPARSLPCSPSYTQFLSV